MNKKRKIEGFLRDVFISEDDLIHAILKSRPIVRDREEYINLYDFLNHLKLYTERFREVYHDKASRLLDLQRRK